MTVVAQIHYKTFRASICLPCVCCVFCPKKFYVSSVLVFLCSQPTMCKGMSVCHVCYVFRPKFSVSPLSLCFCVFMFENSLYLLWSCVFVFSWKKSMSLFHVFLCLYVWKFFLSPLILCFCVLMKKKVCLFFHVFLCLLCFLRFRQWIRHPDYSTCWVRFYTSVSRCLMQNATASANAAALSLALLLIFLLLSRNCIAIFQGCH